MAGKSTRQSDAVLQKVERKVSDSHDLQRRCCVWAAVDLGETTSRNGFDSNRCRRSAIDDRRRAAVDSPDNCCHYYEQLHQGPATVWFEKIANHERSNPTQERESQRRIGCVLTFPALPTSIEGGCQKPQIGKQAT